MTTPLQQLINDLNERACDWLFRTDPYTCYSVGVQRYEDDIFCMSEAHYRSMYDGIRAILTQARALEAASARGECTVTDQDTADLSFLISACEELICWDEEPDVRAYNLALCCS
jgi:hypothetical protein